MRWASRSASWTPTIPDRPLTEWKLRNSSSSCSRVTARGGFEVEQDASRRGQVLVALGHVLGEVGLVMAGHVTTAPTGPAGRQEQVDTINYRKRLGLPSQSIPFRGVDQSEGNSHPDQPVQAALNPRQLLPRQCTGMWEIRLPSHLSATHQRTAAGLLPGSLTVLQPASPSARFSPRDRRCPTGRPCCASSGGGCSG